MYQVDFALKIDGKLQILPRKGNHVRKLLVGNIDRDVPFRIEYVEADKVADFEASALCRIVAPPDRPRSRQRWSKTSAYHH